MPRRSTQQAAATAENSDSDDQLPTTDGSAIHMSQFLRELESAQHLLPADVSYFLVTATAIGNNHLTAVLSPHHSRLLEVGEIQAQNYSVLRPPPIADGFRGFYDSIREGIEEGTIEHLTELQLPDAPPAIPSFHVLAPDRIVQVDMKLRNKILSLITSKGRRRHYADATLSGCALLRMLSTDAKSAVSKFVQSPP